MRYVATFVSLLFCVFVLTIPSRAQTDISLTPYVGYNTAAGYSADLEEYYEGDPDDFEDEDGDGEIELEEVGDDLTSARGGIVVGLGAEIPLPYGESFDLKLRPAVETAFVSGDAHEFSPPTPTGDFERTTSTSQSYFQISADLLAEFSEVASPAVTPYAGAGLTYVRHSGEVTAENTFTDFEGNTETDTESESVTGTALGLNLLGGARFPDVVQFGAPFVQLRVTVGDPTADRLSDLNVSGLGTALTLTAGLSFGL